MNHKLKILLVMHKMNLGGTEKSLLSFLSSLKKEDYDIELLLLKDGGLLRDKVPECVNVKIFPGFENIQPIINDPPLKNVKFFFTRKDFVMCIRILWAYLKIKITRNWYYNYELALKNNAFKLKTDIAIAYAGPHNFITYFVVKNVTANKKIQWIHFDVSKVLSNARFGDAFYPNFDAFYCVSENAKKEFEKMFPEHKPKTKVFENIVNRHKILKMGFDGESFDDAYNGLRIVTLGRLSSEKGQQMIPEVVKRLQNLNSNFRWYLIGDGNLRDQIEKKIFEYNLQDCLILLGSKTNPYGYLNACDIYVQTSLHEGYCITLREAQIFKKPIVTTNFLSASNLIEQGVNGLIVDISEEGLFLGVKKVIKDKTLRDKLSNATSIKETTNTIVL
jgi:glycosyltransferase involved in cell wall biosynthesis